MDLPPMDPFQATTALNFIHLQLVELARDCGKTAKSGQPSLQFFMEVQDKLEKILHETRAACCPPPEVPVMSDFETLEPLGSGSFGTVNLVGHKRTGRTFAMKTIERESVTEKAEDKLLLERDILTLNNSPFVVSMFCSFETTTDFCMVMENAGGGDCAAVLQHYGPLSVQVARLYVAETTLALEYLHSYGIVHRDLKPANMLISSIGHIKVADFGLAVIGPINMTVDLSRQDPDSIVKEFVGVQMAGTPLYLAPEAISETGFGKAVDWWALGVTLFEFLTCAYPFDGDRTSGVLDAVIYDDITWPPEINGQPAVALDIIEDLLVKDPLYRLGTWGASDVKSHRFFAGLDWNHLLSTIQSYEASADHMTYNNPRHDESPADEAESPESPVELLDFCSVTFRFKEVYSSPEHLSLCNLRKEVSEGNEGDDSKGRHHGEDQQLEDNEDKVTVDRSTAGTIVDTD